MDRRDFLRMMVGGVAAAAAARSFPFRVFSFPREIQRAPILHGGIDLGVKVPFELLQDSAFDIKKLVTAEFARRIDRLIMCCSVTKIPTGLLEAERKSLLTE